MSQPPYPPYPGQPEPGSHGYQPPPYGQQPPPAYGQQPPPAYDRQQQYGEPAQYGQPPQYGAAQFGAPPPPPKKKSSTLKIVLGIIGAVVLLCAVGGIVVFVKAKDKVGDVVDAARITVVEPVTLAGREKVTDPAVAAQVASLDEGLAGVPGATGSVGAAYGDVRAQDLVLVAAASSLSGSAQSRYDQFTQGMTQGGLDVRGFTDTDPGPLGGIARCGDTTSSGVSMAVCVWSDNGSIGMLAMLFKKKADLENEFVTMRGQVEQKS